MSLTSHSARLTFRVLRTANLDEIYDIVNDSDGQFTSCPSNFLPHPET
jgi:hypothetical protein